MRPCWLSYWELSVGMIIWGILGLFIGSVLLAVAYKLFTEWIHFEAQELGISAEEIASHNV